MPGYADTRRSDSLRQLDAYFQGKKLHLGKDEPAKADTGAGAAPTSGPAAPTSAPAAQAQPQPQQPAPTADQPQGSAQDPAQSLLDYLLGGDS